MPGKHVIYIQLAVPERSSAVLAGIAVAEIYVLSGQLHFPGRETVILFQQDYLGDRYLQSDRPDEKESIPLACVYFQPLPEREGLKAAVAPVHHLRQLPVQQGKGPFYAADVHGLPKSIQHKHTS